MCGPPEQTQQAGMQAVQQCWMVGTLGVMFALKNIGLNNVRVFWQRVFQTNIDLGSLTMQHPLSIGSHMYLILLVGESSFNIMLSVDI